MDKQPNRTGKRPSIRRLPMYLKTLRQFHNAGREIVSSAHLARELNVPQINVKKDLEITGATGKTGVGYMVKSLIYHIESFLGWNNTTDAFLVGAGNLGQALMGYQGFQQHGLRITAAFDTDIALIGKQIDKIPVFPLNKLTNLASRMHVHLAILTVPALCAQDVCEQLVKADIRGIWNFTSEPLKVPPTVIVHQEDLTAGLAELSVRIKQLLTEENQL